jgi:WD40 repeat protein
MDKPAQTLAGHSEAVGGVAWSPYGRLASGAVDKRVRTWQPDPQDWMQQACQRAGRNLTQAEWMRYLE